MIDFEDLVQLRENIPFAATGDVPDWQKQYREWVSNANDEQKEAVYRIGLWLPDIEDTIVSMAELLWFFKETEHDRWFGVEGPIHERLQKAHSYLMTASRLIAHASELWDEEWRTDE